MRAPSPVPAPVAFGRRIAGMTVTVGTTVASLVGLGAPPAAAAITPHVVATVPVTEATTVAVNEVTHRVYVGHGGLDRIAVISGTTDTVVGRFRGACCEQADLASNDVTGTLFATGIDDNVYALDERTGARRDFLHRYGIGLAVDPTTDSVYTTDAYEGWVYVSNGTTGHLRTTIKGVVAIDVAANVVTRRLYALESGAVAVVDMDTNAVLGRIPVAGAGSSGWGLAIDVRRDLVYVIGQKSLLVINGRTHGMRTGRLPDHWFTAVAVDPLTGRVFVADAGPSDGFEFGHEVLVIDGAYPAVTATVRVGSFPRSLAVDPRLHRVYVTCTTGVFVLAA